jgi:hypothetical protein
MPATVAAAMPRVFRPRLDRATLLVALFLTACSERALPLSPAPSEAVSACVAEAACLPTIDLQSCIHEFDDILAHPTSAILALTSPAEVACLAKATDCNAVAGCLPSQMCSTDPGSCVGDVVHTCGVAFDCEPYGLHCEVQSWVGVGGVKHPANWVCGFESCDNPIPPRCQGSKVVACENGAVVQSLDCADYGQVCATNTAGAPQCTGTGPACDGHTTGPPLRCEKEVLVQCANNHESRTDCAAEELHCISPDGGVPGCALDDQCDPSHFTPSCFNARMLQLCHYGQLQTFDCRQAGFSGCVDDSKSCDGDAGCAGRTEGAHCAP